MTSTPRDPRTGRWSRPIPGVDATSAFGPMGDSIEDIDNISGAPSSSTIDQPRHAPDTDDLATGGGRWPLMRRHAVLVPADEHAASVYCGDHGDVVREAARHDASPMDPSGWLTGADDGLSPEQRADALARRQTPAQTTVYGDGGQTMSPTRVHDPARSHRRR